ncbi:Dtw domain-containing protein, partial [Thalictrum thalictroides]
KDMVWCLYPNKNALTKSVQDIVFHSEGSDGHQPKTNGAEPLNFILIDGTWNNSAAMVRRLKERAQLVWGVEDLPCISLATLGASSMHRLRPQPSWDRTCTAAAAIGLLSELHHQPAFSSHGLDNQADLLDDAVDALLEALTSRRLRMGRSITRRERHKGDVC